MGFCAGVLEHEGDGLRIQPRVEGVEHRAAHRDAEMRLVHGRRIGQQHRHGVADADPAPRQRRREAPRTGVRFLPRVALRAVDHRQAPRIDRCGALDERQRSQRHEVCPGLVQVVLEFGTGTAHFAQYRPGGWACHPVAHTALRLLA